MDKGIFILGDARTEHLMIGGPDPADGNTIHDVGIGMFIRSGHDSGVDGFAVVQNNVVSNADVGIEVNGRLNSDVNPDGVELLNNFVDAGTAVRISHHQKTMPINIVLHNNHLLASGKRNACIELTQSEATRTNPASDPPTIDESGLNVLCPDPKAVFAKVGSVLMYSMTGIRNSPTEQTIVLAWVARDVIHSAARDVDVRVANCPHIHSTSVIVPCLL